MQRFNDIFTEIIIFIIEKNAKLKTKNGEHFIKQMTNRNWSFDFACLSDITGHLNDLNIRLQGRGKFISQLWRHVRSFMEKLSLCICQAEKNDFHHLPSVAKLLKDNPGEIFMTNTLKLNLKTLSLFLNVSMCCKNINMNFAYSRIPSQLMLRIVRIMECNWC